MNISFISTIIRTVAIGAVLAFFYMVSELCPKVVYGRFRQRVVLM